MYLYYYLLVFKGLGDASVCQVQVRRPGGGTDSVDVTCGVDQQADYHHRDQGAANGKGEDGEP